MRFCPHGTEKPKATMLNTTADAVKSILKADPSLSPAERTRILSAIRGNGATPPQAISDGPRILRRREAAARLGRTVRSIDALCAEGVLQKVRLPGRARHCGILESSLLSAIAV